MFYSIFISVMLLDQLSKVLMPNLFPGRFVAVTNRGVAFSFLELAPPGLLTAGLIGLVIVIFFLGRKHWRRQPIASALFWGGALSNLIDRLLLGGVVDWWSWPWFGFKNNLADLSLVLGLIIFIIGVISAQPQQAAGNKS